MLIWFSSLDFVDDIPLTGGLGHKDGIKVTLYDGYFSIELWSTFCILESNQSREIQSYFSNS